jgi:hypothetical protein
MMQESFYICACTAPVRDESEYRKHVGCPLAGVDDPWPREFKQDEVTGIRVDRIVTERERQSGCRHRDLLPVRVVGKPEPTEWICNHCGIVLHRADHA